MTLQKKAEQFYKLHHSGKLLILPNIWDSLGAMLLEDLKYPAVATASASIAYTNGYNDGENIPFDDLLVLVKKIADSVNVPVTADIESGFAENEIQLEKNIRRIIETGIVGINIEDSDPKTKTLLPVAIQCERIRLIKRVSKEMNMSLFVNARTDVYIHARDFDKPESVLDETIKRGEAYKAAGADCFYPITMQKTDDVRTTVARLQMPVNILLMPGVAGINTLHETGVARISLGPSFLKTAIQAMRNLAVKLKKHEGMSDIVENTITSDYLKSLVNAGK